MSQNVHISKTRPCLHNFDASIIVRQIHFLIMFLMIVSAIAAAQVPNTKECGLTAAEAAGLSGDLGVDVQAMANYRGAVREMLQSGRFEQLDCLADRTRSQKERFAGGAWKLHALYDGVSTPVQYPVHPTEEDWTGLLRQLERWVAARPQSVTARIALASAYVDYGWDARGNGYAGTVSQSGWELFSERTAKARRALEAAAKLPTHCPEWYLAMLRVGMRQNWDAVRVRALFDQASRFEPDYYYYARLVGIYLEPKWSGDEGDSERFIQEVADRVGGDQGDILYFQVAAQVLCGCEDDPRLSWPRIQRGFAATEKRYGASMLNLNWIAFLGARYGQLDPVVADKAFTRIGGQWDVETWKTRADFDSARAWAASSAPLLAKRQAMEADADANQKTPSGQRYKAAFAKKYWALVQGCLKSEGGTLDKVETLTSVGENGTVEDMKIYWNGPAAICVYQKLRTFQIQKATPFPDPPHAPYWIRLDLDGGEMAGVASK